jgi:aminoglycoside phosphotransferase
MIETSIGRIFLWLHELSVLAAPLERAVARRITGIEQQAGAGENNVRET